MTEPSAIEAAATVFRWLDQSLDATTGLLTLRKAAALTATSTGVDTVDATYGAPEAAAITATRTRVDEIEAALVAAGILTEA